MPVLSRWNEIDRIDVRIKEIGPDLIGQFIDLSKPTPDGRGTYRSAAGGAMFYSEMYGSVFVGRQVMGKWNAPELKSGKDANGQVIQVMLGLPVQRSFVVAGNVHVCHFERGMIVVRPGGAYVVLGAIYARYRALGGVTGWCGLPTSDELGAPAGGRMSRFDNCDIYWSGGTGAHEVHGLIRDRYAQLGTSGGYLGYPLTDETPVRRGGQEVGRVNRFERGSIYWSPATGAWDIYGDMLDAWLEQHGGPTGALGFPTSDRRSSSAGHMAYCNFENGILAGKGSGPIYRITRLDLYVDRFESRGDDNPGPWGIGASDQDLYVWVTVKTSTGQNYSGRFPNNGDFGSDEHTMQQTIFSVPVRDGAMTIDIDFKGFDYDDSSSNDKLGETASHHDIDNLWDIAPDNVAWHGDFRVFYTLKPDIRIDPTKVREQLFWSFKNFSVPTLGKDVFAQTFSDVGQGDHWYYHPFNELFYQAVYKTIAANGDCFGMCLEAIYARQGTSISNEPISQYQLDQIRRNEICVRHGYQLGGDEIDYFASRFLGGSTRDPRRVFEESRAAYWANEFPVISISNDGTYSKGHALMPYAWDDSDPNRWVIQVANPNNPNGTGASNGPGNIIEILGPRSLTPRFNYQHKSNELWTGTNSGGGRMLSIPLHVMEGQPRTPFWEVMLALLATSFVFLGDGGQTEDLSPAGPLVLGQSPRSGVVPVPFHDMPNRAFELYRVDPSIFTQRVTGLRHRIRSSGSFTWAMRSAAASTVARVQGSTGSDVMTIGNGPITENRPITFTVGDAGGPRKLAMDFTGPGGSVDTLKRITVDDMQIAPKQGVSATLQNGGEELVIQAGAQPLSMGVSAKAGQGQMARRMVSVQPNQMVRVRPADWRVDRIAQAPLELQVIDGLNGNVIDRRMV